jgi:osmotically-inducible protein OsmY
VGPKGYVRSDERIREEVCEMLTRHSSIDASNIECMVKDGELTLSGSVPERRMRYLAEEAAEHSHGVKEIYNLLKVENPVKYSPESE